MLRLRVTVVFDRARQSFDLEGDQITVGRGESSTLVLPMAWVAERHLIFTDAGGALGVRIKPGQEGERVLVNGDLVPPQGVVVQPRIAPQNESDASEGAIDVRLQSYRGDRAILTVWRARPPQFNRLATASAHRHDWKARTELWGAVAVLLAAVGLGAYLLGARTGSAPTPPPPAAPVATNPAPAPLANHDEGAALLERAGAAFNRADLVEAEMLLERARAQGASKPLADALADAIRLERLARDARLNTPPPAVSDAPHSSTPHSSPSPPATPPPAPTPPARTAVPPEEAVAAPSNDAERERLNALLAEAKATAEQEKVAGQQTKGTELGRSALKAAKDALRDQLAGLGGGGDINFAPDDSEQVIVVYRDGTYTVRGYADQSNKTGTSIRLFYLARLTPVGTDRWTVKSLDILQ